MDLLILEGSQIYTYDLPHLNEAFPAIKFPKFTPISTANYKGYRATWATFQKQLYLVGLEARVNGNAELLRNEEITSGHSFPLKVTDWSGKILHMEKSSTLDMKKMTWMEVTETTAITVNKGVVISTNVSVERKPREGGGYSVPAPISSPPTP
jgi:hypothetical protein